MSEEINLQNFVDRTSSNPNRRKLKIISQTPTEIIADIERADENVTTTGTKINANNLQNIINKINDLEDKIGETAGSFIYVNEQFQSQLNFIDNPQEQINDINDRLDDEESARYNADESLQSQINQKLSVSNIVAGSGITLEANENNVTINSCGLIGSVSSGDANSATSSYQCCMVYENGDMIYYGRIPWAAQKTNITVGSVQINNINYTPLSSVYPVATITFHPKNWITREWILYGNPIYSNGVWTLVAATNSSASDNATWDYIIKCKYK